MQWALISIVTASAAHFILRMILGKELGAEGLGVYTLAFTVYLLGVQFAAFGVGAALIKYVAESLENTFTIKRFVTSGMMSSIIMGATMGICLFMFAPFLATSIFHVPELQVPIQLTAFTYPFIAIQKTVLGTLNGFRRMHLFALLNIVQNVAIVIVSIVLVLQFGGGIFGGVAGYVGPTILIGLLSPLLIRDSICLRLSFLWHIPSLREITTFAIYVVLGDSISFLNTQLSSILIGYYLSPTEVGIYAVAILFAQTLTLIPSAIQRVTAPMTATLFGRGDIQGVRDSISSAMKITFLISIVISALMGFFGKFLITSLFSYEFLPSYLLLLILLAGNLVFAPFVAIGATLSSIGKVHICFRIDALCGVLNIILSYLLISSMGLIGAAIATTTMNIITSGINIFLIQKYLQVKSE